MLAITDDLQYNEHKLAVKAQRIIGIKLELQELEAQNKELLNEKPACKKDNLTYEESVEFSKRMDRFQREVNQIEVKRLKLKRQLSAVELQAQKLMPVSGIKIKVSKYSSDGEPFETYCIQQTDTPEQTNKDMDSIIEVERL